MKIEFETVAELESWVKANTIVKGGKWVLRGANQAIKEARREGATIFNRMRLEAKTLGIPDGVIETDLPAFVDEFCVTAKGEVVSHDGTHTLRTFLSNEQVGRDYWKEQPTTPATKPDVAKTNKPKTSDAAGIANLFESGTGEQKAKAAPGSIADLFEN